MTIYYVDVALGNDGNLGTSEGAGNAWASLAKAASTHAAGDTIYIKNSGEYIAQDEATGAVMQLVTVGTRTTPVIWEGYSATPGDNGVAVINAGTNALANCINDSLGIVALFHGFRNLRLTGASSHGANLAGGLNRYKFLRCRFDNCGASGISAGAQCTFILCRADMNTTNGFLSSTSGIFVNCLSFSNTESGFFISPNSVVAGCVSYGNGTNQINGSIQTAIFNSVVDGGATDIGMDNMLSLSTIMNSIIFDCTIGVDGVAGEEPLCTSLNNIFWNPTGIDRTNWSTDSSDINEDPLFTDEDNNDYQLGAGSPAIQAGVDAGEMVNGESFIDIGAQQKEFIEVDYPSEDDVRFDVDFNNSESTGNMVLAAAEDIRKDVQQGTNGTEITGTFWFTAESDVADGVGFGEDGTEFEGTAIFQDLGDGSAGQLVVPELVVRKYLQRWSSITDLTANRIYETRLPINRFLDVISIPQTVVIQGQGGTVQENAPILYPDLLVKCYGEDIEQAWLLYNQVYAIMHGLENADISPAPNRILTSSCTVIGQPMMDPQTDWEYIQATFSLIMTTQ